MGLKRDLSEEGAGPLNPKARIGTREQPHRAGGGGWELVGRLRYRTRRKPQFRSDAPRQYRPVVHWESSTECAREMPPGTCPSARVGGQKCQKGLVWRNG